MRDSSDDRSEEEGTRFEVRRKYWAYTLPLIKEANSGNGAFNNVEPTKENWINGYFGVSGFNLCCVANSDGARVELYLGKPNKDMNKKAFDLLKQHKDAIEQELKTSLIWRRADEIKASKIYIELENVNIYNEVDWHQMANFQAVWSKKFYDVFFPLIDQFR